MAKQLNKQRGRRGRIRVASPVPPSPVAKVDRNCVHLAGEYFVAAELYRLGYSVAMTLGNAKAIDLFAEIGTRTVNVQVKAIKNKKSGGWPVSKKKLIRGVIYVFVCLRDPSFRPEFFITDAAEAKRHVKEYTTRSVINRSALVDDAKVNPQRFYGRWDKVAKALESIQT